MSSIDEEIYSTIFASLKHPVRRKMLRMLSEKPRHFSEMLEALRISSSHLTYHLDNLGELVSKTEHGEYALSTFGEAAAVTMSKVEDAPKPIEIKRHQSLQIKWKSLIVVLLIGLVGLACVSYAQYQSWNGLTAEYEQLSLEYDKLYELLELVQQGASLQLDYTLKYKVAKAYAMEESEVSSSEVGSGIVAYLITASYCVIYSPYDDSTLRLIFSIMRPLSESFVPVNVQKGNALDLPINETAPIIWSVNATRCSVYSVPLASKGWYTISLFGPVTQNDQFLINASVEDIDCWMLIRAIHDDKFSPFIVMTESD